MADIYKKKIGGYLELAVDNRYRDVIIFENDEHLGDAEITIGEEEIPEFIEAIQDVREVLKNTHVIDGKPK